MRLPIVQQLFSDNDNTIRQTDIVMLLTPRIIRTHELRAQDLSPIYIGTQSNMSLTGPPATIGGAPRARSAAAQPRRRRRATPPARRRRRHTPPVAPHRAAVSRRRSRPAAPVLPTGSTQQPVVPPQLADSRHGAAAAGRAGRRRRATCTVFSPPPEPPPPAPRTGARAAAPAAAGCRPAPPHAPPAAPARITLSPPSEMRVGSGPYTVPISIAGASRMSTLTLSITYNPALVRVRNVQEGTFMRQGGIDAGVQQPGRRQERPHRHRDHAAGRQDRRIDVGPAGGAAGRAARRRHRLAGPVGLGVGSRRRRRVAAVPAGGNHGAVRSAHMAHTSKLQRGFTFVELLVVTTIVLILASAVQPLARVTIQRTREAELRRVLREMRTAIDKFKDAADTGRSRRPSSRRTAKAIRRICRRWSTACRWPTTRPAAS